MWDTVAQRMLLIDLNGAWWDEAKQSWKQVASTEHYEPPESVSKDVFAHDVYNLGLSFAVLLVGFFSLYS